MNISIPVQINEESVKDSITSVSPSPAIPLVRHDFIFPTVSQPAQEIWKSATANIRSTTGKWILDQKIYLIKHHKDNDLNQETSTKQEERLRFHQN